MEYALVNIVMGDIADIEKKKNSGLTNLLLGVRAPAMGMAGGLKTQKSFQAMQEMGTISHAPELNDQGVLKRDDEVSFFLNFFFGTFHINILSSIKHHMSKLLPVR